MEYLNFTDRLEEFKRSRSRGEKFKSGAKIFGTLVGNAAIGTGKLAVAVIQDLPDFVERKKKELEQQQKKQ